MEGIKVRLKEIKIGSTTLCGTRYKFRTAIITVQTAGAKKHVFSFTELERGKESKLKILKAMTKGSQGANSESQGLPESNVIPSNSEPRRWLTPSNILLSFLAHSLPETTTSELLAKLTLNL
jgi:hypothetical protein